MQKGKEEEEKKNQAMRWQRRTDKKFLHCWQSKKRKTEEAMEGSEGSRKSHCILFLLGNN